MEGIGICLNSELLVLNIKLVNGIKSRYILEAKVHVVICTYTYIRYTPGDIHTGACVSLCKFKELISNPEYLLVNSFIKRIKQDGEIMNKADMCLNHYSCGLDTHLLTSTSEYQNHRVDNDGFSLKGVRNWVVGLMTGYYYFLRQQSLFLF